MVEAGLACMILPLDISALVNIHLCFLCSGFKFSQLEMSGFPIFINCQCATYLYYDHIEVVLSLLIEAFKFSPPKDKEVIWHMNAIATPAVVGSDLSRPQLPLVVELAN